MRTSQTRQQTSSRSALAVIVRSGKILLQRRREHIADAGTWVLPGGECRKGESPRDALVRVCAEELGISVRPSSTIGSIELQGNSCPVWHVIWKGKEIALSGENTLGIGWFTPEELMDLSQLREREEIQTFIAKTEFFTDMATEGTTDDITVSSPLSEESHVRALVRRAQNDDHEAFAEIYDIFIGPIHRYVAFRLTPAMVEDVVADIFVKAWEKLDTYTARQSIPFSSWLFRIAKNIVIDTYRTHRNTTEVEEYHIDEDRWNDPRLQLTQDVQTTLLRKAMNKIPKRYREVLLLSFMADLSHSEIARSMGIREGSVRILKHRALKKIKDHLPTSMGEELP